MNKFDRIDESLITPKYIQMVEIITSDIRVGIFKPGEKIPSINESSARFDLSRATVEKAYGLLREQGYIIPVKGKGFYVASTSQAIKPTILFVMNKISEEKKVIYNSFSKRLGENSRIDLRIHHCSGRILERIIIESLGFYDYYVIMPLYDPHGADLTKVFNMIPAEKLILLHKEVKGIDGDFGCIYEDFETDIQDALSSVSELLKKKYRKIYMVFPENLYYLSEITRGFSAFCQRNSFTYEITKTLDLERIQPKDLYIVVEKTDLVSLIKWSDENKYKIGQNLGIICYNTSPYKKILAGGITVISTDYKKMGKVAAHFILNKSWGKFKNPFTLTVRNSI